MLVFTHGGRVSHQEHLCYCARSRVCSRRVAEARMTIATVRSGAVVGIDGIPVDVEVDIGSGLPAFNVAARNAQILHPPS